MVHPMRDKIMLPSYYHHIVFTLICSIMYILYCQEVCIFNHITTCYKGYIQSENN